MFLCHLWHHSWSHFRSCDSFSIATNMAAGTWLQKYSCHSKLLSRSPYSRSVLIVVTCSEFIAPSYASTVPYYTTVCCIASRVLTVCCIAPLYASTVLLYAVLRHCMHQQYNCMLYFTIVCINSTSLYAYNTTVYCTASLYVSTVLLYAVLHLCIYLYVSTVLLCAVLHHCMHQQYYCWSSKSEMEKLNSS